jgi:hypothetical protein
MKKLLMIALLAVSMLSLILNSAGASEYAFGTKVNATDSDIGKPLFAMPSATTIAFWDTGVVPGYDDTDVVYLHTSSALSITANDVRLTPFGIFPAGSKVTQYDNDIGMPLTGFAGGFSIRYLDLYGSASYDLKDPVYVHQNAMVPNPGAYMTVTNDIRLTLEPGTRIRDFDLDHNKVLGIAPTSLGPIGFFDVNGNGLYDYSDDVYLNYPSGVPKMTVSVNNVRLSGKLSV